MAVQDPGRKIQCAEEFLELKEILLEVTDRRIKTLKKRSQGYHFWQLIKYLNNWKTCFFLTKTWLL